MRSSHHSAPSSGGPGRFGIIAKALGVPLLLLVCGSGSYAQAPQAGSAADSGATAKAARANEARCRLAVLNQVSRTHGKFRPAPEGNISIDSVSLHTEGAFTPPGTTTPITGLPGFCRVLAVAAPTIDSHINVEVWLPTNQWRGRYLSVGEGGLHGRINYGGLAAGLTRGYATASTDTGHDAADPSWMIGQPEKVIDAGYRGKHLQAVAAKAIIEAYYGQAPARSYHAGCSGGGRQALMSLQRYPDDYDGYVVGAPANNWTGQVNHWINKAQASSAPGGMIPPTKLPAITAAAMAQCDALDGLADGIITDPRPCNFNPDVLLCTAGDDDSCLTAPQLDALKAALQGPVNSAGQLLFPGDEPGTDLVRALDPFWNAAFGDPTVGGMLYNRTDWDFRTYNFDIDAPLLEAQLGHILNANDPDLRVQKARGIKVIQYHGWIDEALSPKESINYYDRVVTRMGGMAQTRDFFRLFMVPGMDHCSLGGPGPNFFGQAGGQSVTSPLPDSSPSNDVLMALERWVEQGVAPDRLIATKYEDDVVGGEVSARRPLCPHPQVQKYNGTGDPNLASSFTCATP